MHQSVFFRNPHTIDLLQSSLAMFIRWCPHPALVIASLWSNTRLRKPDFKDPGCYSYVRCYILSLLLAFQPAVGQIKLTPKGPGTLTIAQLNLQPCYGKTLQSKRLSSIIIVHSRFNGNLVSSLFI